MLEASLKKAIVVPFSYFTKEQSDGRSVDVTVLLLSTLPPCTLLAATKHSVALPTLVVQEPLLCVEYSISIVFSIRSVQGHSSSPL